MKQLFAVGTVRADLLAPQSTAGGFPWGALFILLVRLSQLLRINSYPAAGTIPIIWFLLTFLHFGVTGKHNSTVSCLLRTPLPVLPR
jgi:hypothetical protein